MFRGAFTALVTPFRNGGIDVAAFEKLIENQIAAGISGVVAVGTTGESPTLSHDERQELVRLAVAVAKKRCQVLAGTGSNATQHAVLTARSSSRRIITNRARKVCSAISKRLRMPHHYPSSSTIFLAAAVWILRLTP
jgi:N-acyl-D-aspartate/D-glutamate deacylase